MSKFELPNNKYLSFDLNDKNYYYDIIQFDNDINNLNLLVHWIQEDISRCRTIYLPSILKEYCKIKYVPNPKYIKYLLSSVGNYNFNMVDDILAKSLIVALNYKSYDMANYLLAYGANASSYVNNANMCKINNDEDFNNVANIIEYLIKKNTLLVPKLYKSTYMSRDFKYKNQLLNLLEKYVDKEITNLLLC